MSCSILVLPVEMMDLYAQHNSRARVLHKKKKRNGIEEKNTDPFCITMQQEFQDTGHERVTRTVGRWRRSEDRDDLKLEEEFQQSKCFEIFRKKTS